MSISDAGLSSEMNVGELERYSSLALGALLILNGMRKPSVVGIAGALAGGALIWRGVTGYSGLYQTMSINTAAETEYQDVSE